MLLCASICGARTNETGRLKFSPCSPRTAIPLTAIPLYRSFTPFLLGFEIFRVTAGSLLLLCCEFSLFSLWGETSCFLLFKELVASNFCKLLLLPFSLSLTAMTPVAAFGTLTKKPARRSAGLTFPRVSEAVLDRPPDQASASLNTC